MVVEKDEVAALAFSRLVNLSVLSKKHDIEMKLTAEVVSATENDERLSLRLRFKEDLSVLSEHGDEIHQFFNRRSFKRSSRIQTNTDFNAMVAAVTDERPPGSEWFVEIYDISNVGVSLICDKKTHEALREIRELMLSSSLMRHENRITVACRVRHRNKFENGYCYGCEYDWDNTQDPLNTVAEIADYVMSFLETTVE